MTFEKTATDASNIFNVASSASALTSDRASCTPCPRPFLCLLMRGLCQLVRGGLPWGDLDGGLVFLKDGPCQCLTSWQGPLMVRLWGRFGTGCARGYVRKSFDPKYNVHDLPALPCVCSFSFEARLAVEAQGGIARGWEGSGV